MEVEEVVTFGVILSSCCVQRHSSDADLEAAREDTRDIVLEFNHSPL